METGAFGSGKAGSGSVDPLAYLRKPSVVFRIGALVSLILALLSASRCQEQQVGMWPSPLTTMWSDNNNKPTKVRLKRPDILSIIFQLFSVIMFASISNEAWQPNADGKEICIMNDSGKSDRNIDHLSSILIFTWVSNGKIHSNRKQGEGWNVLYWPGGRRRFIF